MKPHGLWYAFGKEWIEYAKREGLREGYNTLYVLTVDSSEIYMIDSEDTLNLFVKDLG